MRYFIKLSYKGAGFSGWQIQKGAPSIQETLEKALSTLLGEEISVTGAGRTDTGVNAVGYVAHFDSESPVAVSGADFCYKINAILPTSIKVHEIIPASPDFHARFDARSREYTYFLHREKDPFAENFSLWYGYPVLDFEAMNEAAQLLLGTHDFSCFEKTGGNNKTSICTVTEARWTQYVPTHVSLLGYPSDGYWYFRIKADRFLRNMVRAVVGSLLEVGRGRHDLPWFASLIADPAQPIGTLPDSTSSDGTLPDALPRRLTRSDAGESVPGHPLFLSHIDY